MTEDPPVSSGSEKTTEQTVRSRLQKWCLVMLAAGSKQSYVFATNKQRIQLAASDVLYQMGKRWVDAGLQKVLGDEVGSRSRMIVQTSALAIFLVDQAESARAIVSHVTGQAVRSETDVDVWGVVREDAITIDPHDPGLGTPDSAEVVKGVLAKLFQAHDQARFTRSSPVGREIGTPFDARCSYSGRPASDTKSFSPNESIASETAYASRAVGKLWDLAEIAEARSMVLGAAEDPSERPANNSRERLERRILGPRKGKDEDEIDAALMDLERLKSRSDDLDHNGWYGILHADGNGMGRVFQNLSEAYATGEEILRQEKKLSADLDEIVWGAVGDAIVEVQRTGPDAGRAKGPNGNTIPYKDWILPIIVGGDDISAVLSGRMALSFAIALSQAYETRIQTKPDFGGALRKLAEKKVDVPKKLSLGLGLIFVKPHHPFSHAIQLAEDLTGMAKKKSDNASMLAFHVLHEPSVRRWDDLHSRDEWKPGVPAAPDAAPLVIPVGLRETTDDPSSTRREGPIHHRLFEGTPTTTLEKLWYLMRLCDSRVPLGEDETRETDARFSRSSLHRLRAVLSTPAPDEETYEARIAPVMSQLGLWEKRMKIPLEERDFLRKNRRLLVPALDALDMERGTAA